MGLWNCFVLWFANQTQAPSRCVEYTLVKIVFQTATQQSTPTHTTLKQMHDLKTSTSNNNKNKHNIPKHTTYASPTNTGANRTRHHHNTRNSNQIQTYCIFKPTKLHTYSHWQNAPIHTNKTHLFTLTKHTYSHWQNTPIHTDKTFWGRSLTLPWEQHNIRFLYHAECKFLQ